MPAFCCFRGSLRHRDIGGAGWSSPVARQAHNLKVVGSNPTPATNKKPAFPMGWRAFLFVLLFASETIGGMSEMGWLAGIASDAFFVPPLLYPDESIC
jgi:hypothetical protein